MTDYSPLSELFIGNVLSERQGTQTSLLRNPNKTGNDFRN
jgi:hypothetical protein